MPETMFHKTMYRRLSCMFGHIAHYSRDGFWHEWFETAEKRKAWLRYTVGFHIYGQPQYTMSDVEKVLISWISMNWATLNALADRED